MFANHCGYVTSLINPASNRHCTSTFVASIFSSDILQSFYFLGFVFWLTCSLCSITFLLSPIKSEVDQAKTSLFLSMNCRSFTYSSVLISALMQMVLSGTLGSRTTLVKSPSAFLNSAYLWVKVALVDLCLLSGNSRSCALEQNCAQYF
jgi:hypothetical protein